jgi:hypothetical protein
MLKLSPAQRRATAIARRFQPWYLTDGLTSPALHISSAFACIRRAGEYRREVMAGTMSKAMCWRLALNELGRADRALQLGRRSSPLP